MKKIYSSPMFMAIELESKLLQGIVTSTEGASSDDSQQGEGGDVKEFTFNINLWDKEW